MPTDNQGIRYDNIAAEFAELRTEFYKEKPYLDLLTSQLKPAAEILDVGCGSGKPIAAYLIAQGFQVTGIDASINLLKIANQNCPTLTTIHSDIRTISFEKKFDAIVEWCLFHLPKIDHGKMLTQFASWLKKDGLLQFTTGDHEYAGSDDAMLAQILNFYSLAPAFYEQQLKQNGFKLLLRESDQPQHLVWLAKFMG